MILDGQILQLTFVILRKSLIMIQNKISIFRAN